MTIYFRRAPPNILHLEPAGIRRFFILLILLLLTAGVTGARSPEVPREVLAFYHWNTWRPVESNSTAIADVPKLGAYDGQDTAVLDQHFRWAVDAGLTGFVVSWSEIGDYRDRTLRAMLDIAEKRKMRLTACLDSIGAQGKATIDEAVINTLYLVERYRRHPAWLRAGGSFVVFISPRALGQLQLPGWQEVVRRVNGKHGADVAYIAAQISPPSAAIFHGVYAPASGESTAGRSLIEIRDWARLQFPEWKRMAGDSISILTIFPGIETGGRTKSPGHVTARYSGDTYRVLWEEAIAVEPEWVLIDSWNDWARGTEIEPSRENGDRDLRSTRQYAREYLAGEQRASPLP